MMTTLNMTLTLPRVYHIAAWELRDLAGKRLSEQRAGLLAVIAAASRRCAMVRKNDGQLVAELAGVVAASQAKMAERLIACAARIDELAALLPTPTTTTRDTATMKNTTGAVKRTARKAVTAAALLFGLMGVAHAAPQQTECQWWADIMNNVMDAVPAKHDAILRDKGVNLDYFAVGNILIDEVTGGKVTNFHMATLHKAPNCTMEREIVKHRFDQQHTQAIQNKWGR